MFIISFDFFTFLYLSQRLIFVICTEANHFCDVCEGDTGLRTDPLTLVMAHNIPGEVILFSFNRLYKLQISKGCKEHLTSRCPQKWEQTISFHNAETEAVAWNSDAGAKQK